MSDPPTSPPQEESDGSNERRFGSGTPVLHQGELPEEIRLLLSSEMPYEPITDRFALSSVWLRVEERWADGCLGGRITLRTAGWRSLPNIEPELANDEDIEDAFLGMATRLPTAFIEYCSGARLLYDTGSFLREDRRSYRMDYRVMGDPNRVLAAIRELRRANDIRWKKAHRMLGYTAGGEEHSEEKERVRMDRMYGPGIREGWLADIQEYDSHLVHYCSARAIHGVPNPHHAAEEELRPSSAASDDED